MGFSEAQKLQIRATFEKAHKEREEKYRTAEILAIKCTYNALSPDATFEILFMTREEANDYRNSNAGLLGKLEEITFAQGVALAKQDDCSGGVCSLRLARRFQQLNPAIQALNLGL